MNRQQLSLNCSTPAALNALDSIGQELAELIRLYSSERNQSRAAMITINVLNGIFETSSSDRRAWLTDILDGAPAVDDLVQEILDIVEEYEAEEIAA